MLGAVPPLLLALVPLLACGDPPAGGDSGGDPGDDPGCTGLDAITDAHQFRYTSDLRCTPVPAQSEADVCLDWSTLSVDIQGHAVAADPGITDLRMVVFDSLSWDEILTGLASDTLDQSDVGLYMRCEPAPGETTCCLDQFGIQGSTTAVSPYFTQGSGRWLFALSTDGVDGSRTLACLEPRDDSATTTVLVDDDSASLDMDVDLQAGDAACVQDDVTLDWSALTVDGLGNPFQHARIDLLQVAAYDQDLGTLQDRFVDLPTLAAETWSLDVTGRQQAALSELSGPRPLTGLDADHTWLFVLWCSTCENPVPKAIAVLEPTP